MSERVSELRERYADRKRRLLHLRYLQAQADEMNDGSAWIEAKRKCTEAEAELDAVVREMVEWACTRVEKDYTPFTELARQLIPEHDEGGADALDRRAE